MVTPEQRVANVVASLRELAERKSYNGQINDIRVVARQAEELLDKWQRGELQPLTSDLPF